VILLCLIILISIWAGMKVKRTDAPQVIVNTGLDIAPSDLERVKNEAERAVSSICPILGVQKKMIRISIIEQGICHTLDGIIYLPMWHVQNKKAAIVPLVLNVLAQKSENRFFSGGLGVYFQDRFGEDNGFPNFSGAPLDDLVRTNQSRLFGIHELANNNHIFRQVGTRERIIAFIQAGAFIQYLVETYGEKKLVDLYHSSTLDYREIYGKDIKELGVEWEKSVFGDKTYQFPAGIIAGPKAAFLISAPKGWVLDNRSGLSQGLHCVLYPKRQTWANSRVKLYAKIASTQYSNKEDFIEFAMDSYKKEDPDFSHRVLRQSETSEGFGSTIIEYDHPRFSQYELVGYIQVPDAVAYIVFVARDIRSRLEYSKAFDEVIQSFLYKPDYISKTEAPVESPKGMTPSRQRMPVQTKIIGLTIVFFS
jgi:hypothetical protein